MNICATIAEFNPFHNGHAYLIDTAKSEYDACIAVMSGNFVQRGSPAIYDKFTRAKAAIANGIDLVIELPLIYSLSSAEGFATGAVKILNATGVVSNLFFGSEAGDTKLLQEIATLSMSEDDIFKEKLKENLSSGMSYPAACADVLEGMGVDKNIISSPNNILAIEYIKSLIRTNSKITPQALKRYGALHDSNIASNSIASASLVRRLIENGSFTQNFMPYYPYPTATFEKHFADIILYALRSADYDTLLSVPDCTPALASRFIAAKKETDIISVIAAIKSKNFTESRLKRILWNLVLKNNFSPSTNPTYIRILAQNSTGSKVLAQMKKDAVLPVIQKGVDLKNDAIFNLESKATDIYNIPSKKPCGSDFRHSPIVIS